MKNAYSKVKYIDIQNIVCSSQPAAGRRSRELFKTSQLRSRRH